MKLDLENFAEDELPPSPDSGLTPARLTKVPKGFAWYLVDSTGERVFSLSQKSGIARWNHQRVRTNKEGAERNVLILEMAQKFLNPEEPMTLRHLFYLLVSAGIIENEQKEYEGLSRLITKAREEDDVDDDCITDGHRTVMRQSGYDNLAEFARVAPFYYDKNRWPSQGHYVECWFEKAAIMSVVEGLSREYQVTMRPFKGHASRTYCANIAEDFSKVGTPITVFYCGDHDPSGYAIPRSGQERVREILGQDYHGKNADFEMIRVGFNPVHFDEHNLESWDVEKKISDSNYQRFLEMFPDGRCAELDAIPPDELRSMLREAIESRITDWEAWEEAATQQEDERQRIRIYLQTASE